MQKLIIYAALGYPQATNPRIPAVPRSWDELAEASIAAAEAGANIIQFHGPLDKAGKIDSDKWGRLTESVRKHCKALISFGKAGPPIQRRPLLYLGSGTPDFLAVSLTAHDYRRGTTNVYYEHSRTELEECMQELDEAKVLPAWEVWHLGGLWNFRYLLEKGLCTPPHLLTLFFSTPGSVWSPATVEEINHRIKHVPADCQYIVAPRVEAGPIGQTRMLTFAMIKGGHVRLGTQDVTYYADGVPAESDAQLVARIVRIAKELGREVATPEEVRQMLGVTLRR